MPQIPGRPDSAATDVPVLISELDAGMFERAMSIACSEVAAAVVDNDKDGEVSVKFTFKKIPGTVQVHCVHELTFKRPTEHGSKGESLKRVTPLYVGKFGALTIAPENQLKMFQEN